MRLLLVPLLIVGLIAGCAPPPSAQPTAATKAAAPAKDAAPAAVPTIAAPVGPQPTAAVAATTAPAKPAANVPTGSLTVIQQLPITTLDASVQQSMAIFNPTIHMTEPLVFREPNGSVKPFLASEWSYPNPNTLRFKLRPGIKFHNGEPLTADDVAFTFNLLIKPETKSRHLPFLRAISEVKAVDPQTVEFLLKNPDATLLGRLSILPVMPKKYVESVGLEGFGQKPIGTGAWKLVEWVKGQRVVMEANMDYWRGPPKIKTITFREIAEDNTRVAELLAGNADVVNNVPPELLASIKSDSKVELQSVQSLRNVFLKFNTKKAPYSDLRVRQAIAHAIDVKLIIETVLGGNAVPTPGGYEGVGVWGHYKNLDKGYEYNPEKAKELLAAAGVKPGTEITILSAKGRLLNDAEVVQAIAGMLQNVGFNAKVQLLDFTVVNDEWNRKYREELDLHFWSNANNTADADYNYNLNFNSKGQAIYWSEPEIDELIMKARTELDPDKRMAMYQEIGQKILEALPAVPLYDQLDSYGVNKRVKGFKARSDEMMYFYDAEVAN